jgi:serine/threonine-protein kinase
MSAKAPGDPPNADGPVSVVSQGLAFAETDAGKRALSRAAAKAKAAEDLAGEVLAERYRLIKQIGRGGMGAVYLAEHTLIGKEVAVKVLGYEHSQRPQDIERFLLEARAASKIRHEHIVDITDFGYTDDGLAFLVMEYLEGEDLAVTCKREGRFDWRRTLAIAEQLCGALGAAHRGGIIHRDMKLENCFRIQRAGNEDFIKVLDFGIAKILDDAQHNTEEAMTQSALVGTPEYVAPELVRGLKADPRADIYAVGVVMYKLITGEVPLRGESYMATLTKHLLEKPLPPRRRVPSVEIPEAVDELVMRALEKEPEKRFQTVDEMAAAIAAIRAGAAGPTRRGRVLGLIALFLVVGAGLIGWSVLGGDGTDAAADSDAEALAAATAPAEEPDAPPVEASGEDPEASDSAVEVEAAATTTGDDDDTTGEASPDELEPETEPEAAIDRLSAREVSRGLAKVQSSIKRCSKKYAIPGMKVKVRLKIGASGRVSSVELLGSHSGSSLGACIVRAVRKATFPKKDVDTTITRTIKL